jgi:hypothetical protein
MRFRLCITCCLLLAVANVAIGDDEAASLPLKFEGEDLVLGDWYRVDMRDEKHVDTHIKKLGGLFFQGWLFKVNEKWIVLGVFNEETKAIDSIWISRERATIAEHNEKRKLLHGVEGEYPRSTEPIEVRFARSIVLPRRYVRVVGVKDSDLVLEDEKVPLRDVLWVRTVASYREPFRLQPAQYELRPAPETTDVKN